MSETAKPRGYYDDQSDSTTGPGMASTMAGHSRRRECLATSSPCGASRLDLPRCYAPTAGRGTIEHTGCARPP